MNTKDILGLVQARLGFTEEVTRGLSQFFRDFERSPHGQRFEVSAALPSEPVWQGLGQGGVDIELRRECRDPNAYDERAKMGITINADGLVEVHSEETYRPDRKGSGVETFSIQFDPALEEGSVPAGGRMTP